MRRAETSSPVPTSNLGSIEVRDPVGNLLTDGDQMTLIKGLVLRAEFVRKR